MQSAWQATLSTQHTPVSVRASEFLNTVILLVDGAVLTCVYMFISLSVSRKLKKLWV